MLSLKNFEWDEEKFITFPIGQKLIIDKKYPFVANPFNVVMQDPLIVRGYDNDIITTQNSNLVFEYSNICGNNIFICFAEEVLKFAQNQEEITEKYMISLYFPFLFKEDIHSLSQLEERKHSLFDDQKKTIGNNFKEYNDNIDLFYNIFAGKKKVLPYIENTVGISELDFTIHPRFNINFPLEILFKLINSNQQIPFIKYNPGNNRENIYRLFVTDIAKNGKKIPYLYTINGNKKRLIMKISKMIATRKRVAFYITEKDSDTILICEVESNGNINISLKLSVPTNIENIEELIRNAINIPILNKISNYLAQSGYTYISFVNLKETNVEIKNINYTSSLVIRKNIHLNKFIKCLSSVFNIIEGNLTNVSEKLFLMYKRFLITTHWTVKNHLLMK